MYRLLGHFFSEEAPGAQDSLIHRHYMWKMSVGPESLRLGHTHICTSSVLLCKIVLGPEKGT
jgi:hypothetical protein